MDAAAPPSTTSRKLLSPSEAAAYLSIAPRSLTSRRWRDVQGIPYFKLGRGRLLRFDQVELDAWIESRRTGQSAA